MMLCLFRRASDTSCWVALCKIDIAREDWIDRDVLEGKYLARVGRLTQTFGVSLKGVVMCLMCQIRTTLKKAMDEIDALPEVNSALYDDTVAEAYQALETAYYMHQHSCDENAEQCLHTDPPSALPSVVEYQNTAGG